MFCKDEHVLVFSIRLYPRQLASIAVLCDRTVEQRSFEDVMCVLDRRAMPATPKELDESVL